LNDEIQNTSQIKKKNILKDSQILRDRVQVARKGMEPTDDIPQ
jgi:hypothetical protein